MNDIYEDLLKSKKYAHITPGVLERVCEECASRYPKKKDAIKAAKTELHIINESYLFADCHKKAEKLITEYIGTDISSDRDFALSLMELHASSKERIPFVEKIYGFLSDYVDESTVLGDIGCGFSPMSLSFFRQLPAEYKAYEINEDTVNLLNLFFEKTGNKAYTAQSLDAVSSVPSVHFDTVFLFKLLPVLQQQKKGRAFEVLKELDFHTAVVSFPLKSLSGKNKGMTEHYSSFFEDGLPEFFEIIKTESIGNELFYIIKKRTAD